MNKPGFKVFENQIQGEPNFISSLAVGSSVDFSTFVIEHEEPDELRGSRPVCEREGVKFPLPTRLERIKEK